MNIKNVEKCPNFDCNDSGGYPVPDGYGDWQAEQCEFCWTVKDSFFHVSGKCKDGGCECPTSNENLENKGASNEKEQE
jgi:hypothetical protein